MKSKLFEQLAAIQHDIWAHWQQYIHAYKMRPASVVPGGKIESQIIRQEDVEHWDRQISTLYVDLTEKEKDSDREQVKKFWPLIEDLITVKSAIETLKQAFEDDPDFAHGWHCNIAMACYDSIGSSIEHSEKHSVANDAASRFMKLAFDVVTFSEKPS